MQIVRQASSSWRDPHSAGGADPTRASWASTDQLRALYGQKRSKDASARYRADTAPSAARHVPDPDVMEEEEEEPAPLTAASLHFEVSPSQPRLLQASAIVGLEGMLAPMIKLMNQKFGGEVRALQLCS